MHEDNKKTTRRGFFLDNFSIGKKGMGRMMEEVVLAGVILRGIKCAMEGPPRSGIRYAVIPSKDKATGKTTTRVFINAVDTPDHIDYGNVSDNIEVAITPQGILVDPKRGKLAPVSIPLDKADKLEIVISNQMDRCHTFAVKIDNPQDSTTGIDVTLNGTPNIKSTVRGAEDTFFVHIPRGGKNIAINEGENPMVINFFSLSKAQYENAITPKNNTITHTELHGADKVILRQTTNIGNGVTVSSNWHKSRFLGTSFHSPDVHFDTPLKVKRTHIFSEKAPPAENPYKDRQRFDPWEDIIRARGRLPDSTMGR